MHGYDLTKLRTDKTDKTRRYKCNFICLPCLVLDIYRIDSEKVVLYTRLVTKFPSGFPVCLDGKVTRESWEETVTGFILDEFSVWKEIPVSNVNSADDDFRSCYPLQKVVYTLAFLSNICKYKLLKYIWSEVTGFQSKAYQAVSRVLLTLQPLQDFKVKRIRPYHGCY